jgi:hypothetical protein
MMGFIQQLKTIFSAVGFVLLTGLVGISSSVMASTPDGETPANEGVCDILIGKTPGLYGLCVAYCEAQDLDTFEKEPPNTKILENYNKKRARAGDTDPLTEMPCLQKPASMCPCWSDEEIASFRADGMIAACPTGSGKIQVIDNTASLKFADADTNAGREQCRYIDLNLATPTIRFFSITLDEAAGCFSDIQQVCQQP